MSIMVNLDYELEQRFRSNAMKKFGYGKGAITEAVEEAFGLWVSSVDKTDIKEVPLESLIGLMSHVKNKTGVEIQHEAKDLFVQREFKHKK